MMMMTTASTTVTNTPKTTPTATPTTVPALDAEGAQVVQTKSTREVQSMGHPNTHTHTNLPPPPVSSDVPPVEDPGDVADPGEHSKRTFTHTYSRRKVRFLRGNRVEGGFIALSSVKKKKK